MADGTQFPPRPDYRAGRATRLETAIRATPSNPTAKGCPVGLTGFGRQCWAQTTESCLSRALCSDSPGPPPRVAHSRRWAGGPGGWRGVDGARRIRVGSSQRDSEKSLLARERRGLREIPAAELDELAAIYEAKDVSPQTAAQVAAELTAPMTRWPPMSTPNYGLTYTI